MERPRKTGFLLPVAAAIQVKMGVVMMAMAAGASTHPMVVASMPATHVRYCPAHRPTKEK